MKNQKKLKNLLTADTRISLFQTTMNNTGRNFEGKKITAPKMAAFAAELYKLSIKEIELIGELSVEQIEKTFVKAPVIKVVKKAKLKTLMSKINGRKGKRIR